MLVAAAVVKACALLTAAEIASVQGEKPAKIRESRPQAGTSRCLIALPTAEKSVSVDVTQGRRAVQFTDRLRGAAEVEGEEAGELETPAIERIPGIGDEAYWAEGVPVGALYVRRG